MDSPAQGRVEDMSDPRTGGRLGKSAGAFRTISEVADELDVAQHVLRFWESKFPQVRPLKRGGGRRYYRPEDVDLLRKIRSLLYDEGYTIKGAQKLLKGQRRPTGDRSDASPAVQEVDESDLEFPEDESADEDQACATSRIDPELKRSLASIRDELVALRATLPEDEH